MSRTGRGRPVRRRRVPLHTGWFLLLALSACNETVLRSGDESEATRAAAALERHGVPAELEAARRGRESSFELVVGGVDAPRARAILAAYGRPRPPRAGAAALAGSAGLVPSPIEERARLAAAVARDVEQSLEAVDGVVEARVHLTFPLAEDPIFGGETTLRPPRAAALVRHLGGTAPMTVEDVRRLVAGAVDGLAPEGVEVVFRPVVLPPVAGDGWESLGPFVVRSGSRGPLLALLVGSLAAIAALAALLVWSRIALRRARKHGG